MVFDLQIPNWVAILVALIPTFAVFIYFTRVKGSMWLAFTLGGAGWFGALLLRILPVQLPLVIYGQGLASNLVYFGYASLLAGLFEEGIRYICVKKASFTREDHRHVLSFGLGWGFLEAVLTYTLNALVILVLMPELTFMELLPGAIERNTAVLLHSALSFLVLCSLKMKRFLIVAMGLHAAVNVIALSIYYYVFIGEVWLVEGILFAMVFIVVIFTYLIVKRYSPIRLNEKRQLEAM